MSDRIRIGFIGAGQIARQHLTRYATMADNVQVVAVADIHEPTAQSAASQFAIPHVYINFHELLKRDDLDAVDVCVHNNLHRPATEAVLRAGKHAYCEKPMAGSYRDAEAMLATSRETGKKLSVQLAKIFAPETRAAKELIDAGELGDVYHARSTGYRRRGRPYVDGYGTPTFVQKRNSAGGALYDMGVYHISRILYLLGNPKVLRVSGKTHQHTDMDAARRKTSGYDVEELGLGLVRFEGGVTMDLIESWAIHLDAFEGSFVAGSKGGVRLDPFGFFRSYGDLDVSGTADLTRAQFRWNNVRGDGSFYESPQHHWIAALQGKCALLPTAEIALSTMLISEAIYLSDARSEEVSADEVVKESRSTAVAI